MTVTKSKNLIANRNTGGNKKQGLVSSIGKSNSVRQSQLVRASSNDKTIYCINQVGGVGRFRNQHASADSTNCLSKLYTINSALHDSIELLNKYNYNNNNYLFSYILINNTRSTDTYVFINNSPYSPHTFNHFNFYIKSTESNILDISFDNISFKSNNTIFLNKFSNYTFNFSNFRGYFNIINRSNENYNDISNNDVSLNNYGFLYNENQSYSVDVSYNILDNYGFSFNYYPFLYGSLHEYTHNYIQTNRLDNSFYVTFFMHLKQN